MKSKLWKKIRKKLVVISMLVILGFVPLIASVSWKFIDDVYEYPIILELKFGEKVSQNDGDSLYSLSSMQFLKNSLNDLQGIKLFLNEIKNNTLIALYRKEETEEYDDVIEKEKTKVKNEKETYKDIYGDTWLSEWEKQLKKDGFKNDYEYILNRIQSTITNVAFKKIYTSIDSTKNDDNGTPNDTSDDVEYDYKNLGVNQLYWFNKWFLEKRPIHLAELKLNLDPKDDFNEVVMTDENKKKFDELLNEFVNQSTDSNIDKIDFSALVTGYSNGSKTDGGNLGIINYTDTKISNIATRYNVYTFINDVANDTLRSNSEIVLDANIDTDKFLNHFTTGERNYFYFEIKNEKFLISRNEKNSISIFRIFGMKDYIDPNTRIEGNLLIDYFKDSPKIFSSFKTKPFDIVDIINSYIPASYPNHAYILARSKGIIKFVNEEFENEDDIGLKIDNYLKVIERGKLRQKKASFLKTINDQNEIWLKNETDNSVINVSSLENDNAWSIWGVENGQ